MIKLTFVVGKGGVGKTTVACALSLHLAARRPRIPVLLLSTDPAHSLADILQAPIGAKAVRVPKAKGELHAWEIDSQQEFKRFLARNRDGILSVLEQGTFFTKNEIAPLFDASLPGMSEVAGLLAVERLLRNRRYGHIVLDTAPFGHTLRLFQLPAHLERFLKFLVLASSRDQLLAQRFGGKAQAPHPFVLRWQRMIEHLRSAFAAGTAEILLVTSAEMFSLQEAARCMKTVAESGPGAGLSAVVINRVITAAESCAHCRRRSQLTRKAQRFIAQRFSGIPQMLGPDPGNPILGVPGLTRFGQVVFGKQRAGLEMPAPPSAGVLKWKKAAWPRNNSWLSFTMGKGGVGKTTMTAALAYGSRKSQPRVRVTLCSTDPAPSLKEVFQKEIGNRCVTVLGDRGLRAIEIDAAHEFRRWAEAVKKQFDSGTRKLSGNVHIDFALDKDLFLSLLDILPPGVDEIFAIFRILDLLRAQSSNGIANKILVDMAPSGHAIQLLETPDRILRWSRLLLKSLAAHRTLALAQDVAVEIATVESGVRRLRELMKNSAQCGAWIVMLAEPAPDRETARLLRAVESIGIKVHGLFVNRLTKDRVERCERCRRAQAWQRTILLDWKAKYSQSQIYLVREFPANIAGDRGLDKITGELWQIAPT